MMRPTAVVLLTGSELLDGRTRDRNGFYLAGSLASAGFDVTHMLVVPDEPGALRRDLAGVLRERPAVVVLSGGLGTTHDDLTAQIVADVTGRALVEHPEALRMVHETTRRVAERRGLALDELLTGMRRQALLPAGARPVAPAGVAPGFVVEHEGTAIVALPGVPWEVEAMWPSVLEGLVGALGAVPPRTAQVRFYGWGEVQVAALLRAQPTDLLRVAITASYGEVTITARHEPGDAAAATQLDALVAALRDGGPAFSSDGRTIDVLLADLLRSRGATVATAESCTGGLLAGRLTELAGSSDYVVGGAVTYADAAKRALLGVPTDLLAAHGAVSEPVARAMAEGARAATGATFALSTTGIAGPGGGTPEKPVGLVYVGCAGPDGTTVRRHEFPGDRATVRGWSVVAALHLLRRALEG